MISFDTIYNGDWDYKTLQFQRLNFPAVVNSYEFSFN